MNLSKDLPQWLAYLEQLHPKGIDLGLERVSAVAAKLELLDVDATVITVAGTNGKGSTVATLAAGLTALNVRYGSYTSPHIVAFNERITIVGKPVADDHLVAAFELIEAARADISLSYFEYTTLAALICFEQSDVDVILLEVGLGGRLDAVNIVDADVAIVTSVALDHQDWLGDSVDKIALEKLGIARPNKPLLIADKTPVQGLQQGAKASQANCLWIDQDFYLNDTNTGVKVVVADGKHLPCNTSPQLASESYAVAVQTLHLLGYNVNSRVLTAMASAQLMGRFQNVTYKGRQLVLDVAHNPAAISRLAARVKRDLSPKTVNVWLGVMADKNVDAMVAGLSDCVDGQWFVAGLDTSRALSAEGLQAKIVQQLGKQVSVGNFSDVITAINTDEVLLICGSFYTVAAGVQSLQNEGLM